MRGRLYALYIAPVLHGGSDEKAEDHERDQSNFIKGESHCFRPRNFS